MKKSSADRLAPAAELGNGTESRILFSASIESYHDSKMKAMQYSDLSREKVGGMRDALELLKEQKWYGEHCGDCEDT